MTEIYRTVSTGRRDDVSPTKCRERRRRRIEMRRQAAVFGEPSSSSSSKNREETIYSGFVPLRKHARTTTAAQAEMGGLPADVGGVFPSPTSSHKKQETLVWRGEETDDEPMYGVVSVMGRSRKMEDTVTVKPSLCKPEINQQKPVHFFAVYDGHGGSQVSTLCSTTMHTLVKEELEQPGCKLEGGGNDVVEEKWRGVMRRSFERMDELAMGTCMCRTTASLCHCDPREAAISGSTAVAAVLTNGNVVVANTGDSRAVLCRNGMAIPLSNDHKPDRPDERARIEAAGGRVLVVDGARVEGILATSRAIGDTYLKPMVAWEPEVTSMRREPGDECLILASDGLWDVLSSQLACDIARFCLREDAPSGLDLNETATEDDNEGQGSSGHNPSRSVLAATLLTRLALGRQSNDNISVIVIDLKNSPP
ncbi:probable protein phosphatase 2C 75 isoform X1 [Brassica napus]|uniref:probable protein phosphatase 2C 75 isoform X1 n=1 Tax=Brassica napus TaxID=3708 RepID=UPI00207AEBA2|nr:probable protein phosphatase 2C 75 isoform X1 [Brassica napus]